MTSIREAIREIMSRTPYHWKTKKQICFEVTKEFPRIARNDESITREIRRIVADPDGFLESKGKGLYRWKKDEDLWP